jgi:hypothetical protein
MAKGFFINWVVSIHWGIVFEATGAAFGVVLLVRNGIVLLYLAKQIKQKVPSPPPPLA